VEIHTLKFPETSDNHVPIPGAEPSPSAVGRCPQTSGRYTSPSRVPRAQEEDASGRAPDSDAAAEDGKRAEFHGSQNEEGGEEGLHC
jgi:hypothetical protein